MSCGTRIFNKEEREREGGGGKGGPFHLPPWRLSEGTSTNHDDNGNENVIKQNI